MPSPSTSPSPATEMPKSPAGDVPVRASTSYPWAWTPPAHPRRSQAETSRRGEEDDLVGRTSGRRCFIGFTSPAGGRVEAPSRIRLLGPQARSRRFGDEVIPAAHGGLTTRTYATGR